MENLKFNHDLDDVASACGLSREEIDSVNKELYEYILNTISDPKSKLIEWFENIMLNGTPVQKRVLATHVAFSIHKRVVEAAMPVSSIPIGEEFVSEILEKVIQNHVCEDCQEYSECDLPFKKKFGEQPRGMKENESRESKVH